MSMDPGTADGRCYCFPAVPPLTQITVSATDELLTSDSSAYYSGGIRGLSKHFVFVLFKIFLLQTILLVVAVERLFHISTRLSL
jgi:hypothetical protein